MYRKKAIPAVGHVQGEYRVAAWAVDRCRHQADADPSIHNASKIELNEFRRCGVTLEATYLIRLFAVFESHLRDIWARAFERDTHPIVRDLIDGCAARQGVPDDILAHAHEVRVYRNSLVHGGEAPQVILGGARQYLYTYLGGMPPEWQSSN